MDLVPIIWGALVGAIGGVLWGLLPHSGRRPTGVGGWLASFLIFGASVWTFEHVVPPLPASFSLSLIAVGWLIEPLGERLRRAASGRGTSADASRGMPSSHP